MKTVGKVIAIIFFVFFFLITLVLATVRFEVLNSSFVFSSFERNRVYEKLPAEIAKSLPNDPNLGKDEGESIARSVSSVTPTLTKNLIEKNLMSIIDFLNGKNDNFSISISPKDLNLTEGVTLTFSTNDFPKERAGFLQIAHGIGNKILLIILISLVILISLYKFTGRVVLLIVGIFTLILSIIAKLFLLTIILNTPSKEPAQVLLLLLSSSIFSDIVWSWIIVGILFLVFWVFIRRKVRK